MVSMPFARPETTVNLSSTRLRTSRLVRAQIPQRAFEFRLPRRPGFQRDPTSPGSKAVPPGGPLRATSSGTRRRRGRGFQNARRQPRPECRPFSWRIRRQSRQARSQRGRHRDARGTCPHPLETSSHFRPESFVPSFCVTGIESRRLKTDPAERYRLTCDCIGLVVAQQDWMMRRGDGRWTSEKRHFRVKRIKGEHASTICVYLWPFSSMAILLPDHSGRNLTH